MIVVDASALLELLLRSGSGQRLVELLEAELAWAPHLLDAEVLQRVVQSGKHGRLTPSEVAEAIRNLRGAPITRVDHRPLLEAVAAMSTALSGYEALYAALAAELGCRLVTADERLARTVRAQLGGEAELLGISGRSGA